VIGPRAMVAAAAPLIHLRQKRGHGVYPVAVEDIYDRRAAGEPSPEAVLQEVEAMARSAGSLHYVLLLGDPAAGRAGTAAFARVASDGTPFLTDHPFTLPEGPHTLAVGRIPARTAAELDDVVAKIVGYETGPVHGDWARRIDVFAGPARFSPMIDAVLERAVTAILESVPYEFDIRVTFAKEDSPWGYAFDRLTTRIADDLAAGALVAVYTGHGDRQRLDSVLWRGAWYEIGNTDALGHVHTAEGYPFFISLTCLTGAYGMGADARSLAEEMVLNPAGPVAVFAASAESHPVPNVTLGQGFLQHLFVDRSPTIGDAVRDGKQALAKHEGSLAVFIGGGSDTMWEENAEMYNLFGDPATRLRYPEPATVKVAATAKVGASLAVEVESPLPGGTVRVTVELPRSQQRDGMVDGDAIEKLDSAAALAAMTENNRKANDRVMASAQADLAGGRAEVPVSLPAAPGRYAVKALIEGDGRVAAGSAWVDVQ